MQLRFTPFPTLFTERLVLRRLLSEDAEELRLIRSDDRVNQYLDRPKSPSGEDILAFIEKINAGIDNNEAIYWVINLKNDARVIGAICFWNISKENETVEIGFEMHPDYHGKGYMQEAIKKVIDYGFGEIRTAAIVGWTVVENLPSIRLMEKSGFKRDLLAEQQEKEKDPNSNAVIFVLHSPFS